MKVGQTVTESQTIWRRALNRKILPVMFAVVVMAVGFSLIINSMAAVMSQSREAEAGVFGGSAVPCDDASASGGAAVRFGAASCTPSNLSYGIPTIPTEPGGNVVYYNGYYYVPTKWGTETQIRMAKVRHLSDLQALKDEASVKAQPVVWNAAGSPARAFVNWPVAMYRLQNKWYIYMNAASSNPPNFSDRLMVIQADTDDPMGSWTFKGIVGQDTWTIGFCPVEWNGQLYMIVSNREGHASGTHHALAIASLSNPWTATSNWTTLTDPTYSWEKWSADGPNTAPINEVDQPIYHNGKLHVVFSASHVNSPNYTAGVITYKGSGSLLDRNNWTKKSTPILARTDQIAGPGQTFTFTSANGTNYLGYAHWKTPTVQAPRPVSIVPVSWDANDLPYINVPAPGATFAEPQ